MGLSREQTVPKATEMAYLATEVYSKFKVLYQYLGEHKPSSFIEECEKQKLRDASDMVCSIKEELISKVDGRPLPLSGPDGESEWARCDGPGYDTKVSIGGTELEMEDLIVLQAWIESAIKWHTENPDRLKTGCELKEI